MTPNKEPDVTITLQQVRSDYAGFSQLSNIAFRVEDCILDDLNFDFTHCSWFDANMCAPFGAILYRLARNSNSFTLSNMRPEIQRVLCKNGFLSNYGLETIPDTYATTIEYKRFNLKDDRDFAYYITRKLVDKGIPVMTNALLKNFRASLNEIFCNAVIHSKTKHGIFTCGQFFPNANRVDFSIADLGVGIRRTLIEKRKITLPAEEAISWAMEGKNTTRTGSIPGGLGLHLLQKFIALNKGRIQIASDFGYWELSRGNITCMRLPNRFPGTVVNIEIRTDDTNSYKLSSEISHEDIF